MQTISLPNKVNRKSPAGADVRFLIEGVTGGMIHSTVPPGQVNRATVHATVSELGYVLEGIGEIWRDDDTTNSVTNLVAGTSIAIPVGTKFQYRNVAEVDLKFLCITMPPWPGSEEAAPVEGPGSRPFDRPLLSWKAGKPSPWSARRLLSNDPETTQQTSFGRGLVR